MRRVSISASSATAAEAAAWIADQGGNAVDAAIASTIVAMTTEPGIVAPGAGAFVTIWPGEGPPVVIDGYLAMPGLANGETPTDFGTPVHMAYGGGMETLIGYASVAVPGVWAGLGEASARFGSLPWDALLVPAIGAVDDGFPLSAVSAAYLAYSHEPIFDVDEASFRALHRPDGARLAEGEPVRIDGLAGSLGLIAAEGPESFYRGTIAHGLLSAMEELGGSITADDLEGFQAEVRDPIVVELDGWSIATNPSPAVGGAVLAAMLLLLDANGFDGWSDSGVKIMADVQRAVLGYRSRRLDIAGDRGGAVDELLATARIGDLRTLLGSPSTVHNSAVDSDGTACSITTSAGYGSGVMIPGTGLWLNNGLGEVELHPAEGKVAPGERLPSNMAPTVARRHDGSALAIGSPGASRITTAMAQVLCNFMCLGMSLHDAVGHPRVHVEMFEGDPTLAFEPGLDVARVEGLVERRFPDISMYFGGVGVAMWDPGAGLFEVADPRRSGAVAVGGV